MDAAPAEWSGRQAEPGKSSALYAVGAYWRAVSRSTRSQMSKEVLQAMVIGAGSSALAVGVYLLSRRHALSFRYTVGWLAFLTVGALSGVLVPLAGPLARGLGVLPAVIVTAAGVLALLAICVQLSISISGLQEQVRTLSEELALHKADRDEHVDSRLIGCSW